MVSINEQQSTQAGLAEHATPGGVFETAQEINVIALNQAGLDIAAAEGASTRAEAALESARTALADAEAAKTAAESAETAAETAASGAETSELNAEYWEEVAKSWVDGSAPSQTALTALALGTYSDTKNDSYGTSLDNAEYWSQQAEAHSTGAQTVANQMVFEGDANSQELTGFIEDTANPSNITPVRSVDTTNSGFVLNLATYSPTLRVTPTPGASLNWDQPVTGFRIEGIQDDAFSDRYLTDISGLSVNGTTTPVANYGVSGIITSGGPDTDINALLQTNNIGTVYATNVSDSSAGSAVIRATMRDNTQGSTSIGNFNTSTTIVWNRPQMSAAILPVTNDFLKVLTSLSGRVTHGNVLGAGNISYANSTTGLSLTTGSADFTYSGTITKDITPTLSLSTDVTVARPPGITGAGAGASARYPGLNISTNNINWTYPSIYVISTFGATFERSDFVVGNAFDSRVNPFGDRENELELYINTPNAPAGSRTLTNTSTGASTLWFGILTAAVQPNKFVAGQSESLVSDVEVMTQTIRLSPDGAPTGYVSPSYTLYGITVNPVQTFVRINRT